MTRKALFEAADRWDIARLRDLLRQTPEFAKARDKRGRTPLHRVAAVAPARIGRAPRDGLPPTKLLLDTGAELDAVRPIPDGGEVFPATPLWYAVARGRNLPLVRFLLQRGAKPDWCLWAAVWNQTPGLLEALLQAGPRVDLSSDGETALIYAVRLRRFAAMERLLEAGADPAARDREGRTALDIAQARRYPKAIRSRLG